MRQVVLVGAVLAGISLVGCNASERGGTKDKDNAAKGSETFVLRGPTGTTTIKQGDRQTVTLTVDRGKDFKQDIALKVDSPSGVKVEVEPKTIKASDSEKVTATLTADKDAAVGNHTVKINAKPQTGNAVDVEIKVKVEKKTD